MVLGGALAAVLVATTPWHPLGGPVPGGAVSPDAARDFTAAELARARSLSSALDGSAYGSLAVGLLVAVLLGCTPLGARLFGRLTRRVPGRSLRIALAGLLLSVISTLVVLPFGVWGQLIRRRYGLTTQGWAGWATDRLIGFGTSALATVVVLVLAGWLIRRLPRGWWAPAALSAFVVVVVVSYVYPVVIEPLYTSVRPMRSSALRTDLMNLARRDGVPIRTVLVADASQRTTTLNAYVSGFGATRRLVVYDTLLKSTPPAQIRLIVAHELGHVAHHDVLYGTVVGGLGASAGVCLLYLVLTSRRVLRRAGVTVRPVPRARDGTRPGAPAGGPSPARDDERADTDPITQDGTNQAARETERTGTDPVGRADGHDDADPVMRAHALADARGVALLLAAFTIVSVLSTPVQNLVSRRIEAHADAHALNLTHDPGTFARMQRSLSVHNLSDPDPSPFDYVMYTTHPTGPQRIAMSRDWARIHHRPAPPSLRPH